jgi:hypothetical protein
MLGQGRFNLLAIGRIRRIVADCRSSSYPSIPGPSKRLLTTTLSKRALKHEADDHKTSGASDCPTAGYVPITWFHLTIP